MALSDASCEKCRYWEAANYDYGTCTRYPPVQFTPEDDAGIQPLTYATDTCGEFKPKPAEAKPKQPGRCDVVLISRQSLHEGLCFLLDSPGRDILHPFVLANDDIPDGHDIGDFFYDKARASYVLIRKSTAECNADKVHSDTCKRCGKTY